MKNLRNSIFIVLIMTLCALPFAAMPFCSTEESIGNETLTEWPSLFTGDGSLNAGYLSDIGDYVEDHFAFRAQLVTANSFLMKTLFGTSAEESVIVGTDNWLYYAATLDDYQHYDNVSDRVLFNEAHNIRLMQDWAESKGKTFLFTIAPNKNTLYPEFMPSSLQVTYAEESDFERLIPYLESEGVNYVDLRSLFEERGDILYYERDSHWTEEGALLAYNALLDAAGIEHETYEDAEPALTEYYGDLGEMIYPSGLYPETQANYLTDPAFLYTSAETGGTSYLSEAPLSAESGDSPDSSGETGGDNGFLAAADVSDDAILVEQDTVTTVNESGSGSLLMFRDSFGDSLLPYMAEAFVEATFSKVVPYDLTQEAASAADVIIVEKVERHLPTFSTVAPLMYASALNMTFLYTSGAGIAGEEDTIRTALLSEDDSGGSLSSETLTVDDSFLEQDSSGTISISRSADGSYVELSGIVSGDLCDVNGRIYAAVTDAGGTAVYEAFCTSSSESDYGYVLYLNTEEIETDILNVRIIVANGSTLLCVCEYESEEYEALRDEWQEEAERIADTYPGLDPSVAYTAWLAERELEEADEESAESDTDAAEETAAEEDAEADPDAATTVVNRQYIEDCGLDTGYWDITYADGHHEYIDVD